MRGELTRGRLTAIVAAGTVAFGAAAWLLLGPVWTIAGVLVGPFVTVAVLAAVRIFTAPDAATLLRNDKPDQAMARLSNELPSWRALARIWPSQFRDALANRLIVQSGALQAMNRDEEALRIAGEAVAIYQDLAAERPGKYGPDLADALDHQSRLLAADERLAEALAAMQVAVRLYRNLSSAEPERYLTSLAECLTCEAARLLAKGWRMADGQHLQDVLRDAAPAVRSAYRADPDHFATVWRAETGAEPPDWLTA